MKSANAQLNIHLENFCDLSKIPIALKTVKLSLIYFAVCSVSIILFCTKPSVMRLLLIVYASVTSARVFMFSCINYIALFIP